MNEIETKIGKTLMKVGVSPSLSGYRYLKSAINMVYDDPIAMDALVKVIYCGVADQNKTTPYRVERAMRHAIERAYLTGNDALLNEIVFCGSNKTKATNAEFIASLTEYLRGENANA